MSSIIAENFLTPNGTAVVPTGTVIMFYGPSAPTGYLECNGQSTSGFDDLEALIGSNTPDIRGEFVRGWDNGRGVDTGRSLGSTQADEFKEHSHNFSVPSLSQPGSIDLGGGSGQVQTPTSTVGGTETRPRNIALMYIIKT